MITNTVTYQYGKAAQQIDLQELESLQKTNPIRGLLQVTIDWLIIAGSIAVCEWLKSPWLYFLAIPVIGSRMQAFGVLAHDASHFLLHKNKKLNNFIGEALLMWPLFASLKTYREEHMVHHRSLKTDSDPEKPLENYEEFHFPKSNRKTLLLFFLDLSGLNFVYYQVKKLLSFRTGSKNTRIKQPTNTIRLLRYTSYVAILGASIYFEWHWQLFMYWIVPFATWYQFIFRMRLVSEHFNVPSKALFQTRTIKVNWIEKSLFYPHNLSYHSEHHLYPAVPCYRLTKLHLLLMKETAFHSNAHVTNGLRGLFSEFVIH